MNAREIDVPVKRFPALLDFINQDVIHLSVVDKALLDVVEKRIWRAKLLGGFLLKVDLDDVIGAHADIQQMLLEETEEKEALSASANSRDDFDEVVVFGRNKTVEIKITRNFHDDNYVLFLLDEATNFKAMIVYHKFLAVCKGEQRALKFVAPANKFKAARCGFVDAVVSTASNMDGQIPSDAFETNASTVTKAFSL